MPLREASVPIRLVGGVDTKSDEKYARKLLKAQNVVFTKDGTLAKRNGYTALGTTDMDGNAISGHRALGKRGDELVMFTDNRLYSYVENADAWKEVGPCYSVSTAVTPVAHRESNQTEPDFATADGVSVYAWVDSSAAGVYYSVEDATTGAVLIEPTLLNAGYTLPRVQAIDSNWIHIYAFESSSSKIQIWALYTPDVASGLASAGSISSANGPYDICEHADGPVIAYETTGGNIAGGFLNGGGGIKSSPTPFSFAATVTEGPVVGGELESGTFFSPSSYVGIAWYDGTSVKFQELADDLTAAGTIQTVATPGGGYGAVDQLAISATNKTASPVASRWCVWYHTASATSTPEYVWGEMGSYAGFSGTSYQIPGVKLATRAFHWKGAGMVNVAHSATLYSTILTISMELIGTSWPTVVARMMGGTAATPSVSAHLPQVVSSGDVRTFVVGEASRVGTEENPVFAEENLRRVAIDFGSSLTHQTVDVDDVLYISGGLLRYDGATVAEVGSHVGHSTDTYQFLTSFGTGGSLSAGGTYSYILVPETYNAQGHLERGPACPPEEIVLAAGDTEARISLLRDIPTNKGIGCGVFRSLDGDASVYYRVSGQDPSVTTGDNAYIPTATAATLNFEDAMSDVDAQTKEPVYTTGGVLSSDPVDSGAVIAEGKGRIWASSATDSNTVYFSKTLEQGVGPEFNAEQAIKFPELGGAITGLGVMDDTLVCFKERAVYAVAGPGPLANPSAGGGFTDPQLITADVGCTTGRSIEHTPLGLVFQSSKGLYLLSRSRQVQYIGADVEGYNSQDVASADLITDKKEIRFLTDSGTTLVFNYEFGEWSEWTGHEGKDAVVVDGVYYYLRNDGTVYKQDSSYTDGSTAILMVIETAWLKLANILQGLQKIWYAYVMGENVSTHTFKFSAAYDYSSTFSHVFTGVNMDGGTAPANPYQGKYHLGKKCQAARFRIEETGSPTGASFEISELLIKGGIKKRSPSLGSGASN